MLCPRCGTTIPDNALSCLQCGTAIPARTAQPQTDSNAVISLVLGILSVTVMWILAAIPAIVLGHISRSNIQKSTGRLKGGGMALAGLVMGYISIAGLPFVFMIAGVLLPNLLQARIVANERSAITTVKTLTTAVEAYRAAYKAYPSSVQALGPPPSGNPSTDAAALLTVEFLAQVSAGIDGYSFSYQQVTATGRFAIHADPIEQGKTGKRHFYVDETGFVRFQIGRPAGARSPLI